MKARGKWWENTNWREKSGLTNGTSTPIKSRICCKPSSLITFSSGTALPSVKLRNRSSSIFGLSASYPYRNRWSARVAEKLQFGRQKGTGSVEHGEAKIVWEILVMTAAQRFEAGNQGTTRDNDGLGSRRGRFPAVAILARCESPCRSPFRLLRSDRRSKPLLTFFSTCKRIPNSSRGLFLRTGVGLWRRSGPRVRQAVKSAVPWHQ